MRFLPSWKLNKLEKRKKIQIQFIDRKGTIELVRIGKKSKVNWSMNSVGTGSDEIYIFVSLSNL